MHNARSAVDLANPPLGFAVTEGACRSSRRPRTRSHRRGGAVRGAVVGCCVFTLFAACGVDGDGSEWATSAIQPSTRPLYLNDANNQAEPVGSTILGYGQVGQTFVVPQAMSVPFADACFSSGVAPSAITADLRSGPSLTSPVMVTAGSPLGGGGSCGYAGAGMWWRFTFNTAATLQPNTTYTLRIYSTVTQQIYLSNSTYAAGTKLPYDATYDLLVRFGYRDPSGTPGAAEPWRENANGGLVSGIGTNSASGYHFTPLVPGQVVALGGMFSGSKTIRLFNRSTGALLAETTLAGVADWAYAEIPPVPVAAGTTYTVAVYLAGSGASERRNVAPFPQVYGNLRIDASTTVYTGSNPTARPTSNELTTMYGQADIRFLPSGGQACVAQLNPASVQVPASAGSGSFAVQLGAGCSWTASSDQPWLSVTSASSGTGPATISFAYSANPLNARSATIVVGGAVFTVAQTSGCPSATLSPAAGAPDLPANGGNWGWRTIGVTMPTGCSWSVSNTPSWITFSNATSGTGSGNAVFQVSPNGTGASRTATLMVAGSPFVVTQSAVCAPPGFTTGLIFSFGGAGGSGSVGVDTTSVCAWTVTSYPSWVSVNAPSSGQGAGSVSFSVAPNPMAYSRSGYLYVSGNFVVIDQAAADVTPPTVSLTSPGSATTLSGSAALSAAASDNIAVTRVDFYAGTTLIGSDASAPYSFTWNTTTVPNGTYSLTARAFDASNNSTQSGAVSVTVSNSVACTQRTILLGQTINDALSGSDCRSGARGTNYYVDRYSFTGAAGQQIVIRMSSTIGLDTYLYLRNPSGTVIAQDDDGGGGVNSRIPTSTGVFTLPVTGTYTIDATSYGQLATGSYSILLQ